MPQTTNPMKVCIHCRRDCGDRPRLRDQHGKYHCKECVEKHKLAHRSVSSSAGDPVIADDGPIPLMEEPDEPAIRPDVCAGCHKPISPLAAVCIHCGFNRSTGAHVDTTIEVSKGLKRKSKPRACQECGADLTGLATPRCPACGKVELGDRSLRAAREEREMRSMVRRSWISPIIMIAMGMAIMLTIYSQRAGAGGMVYYLASFGVSLAIGLFVYFVCSVMWIGFDEPAPLTALRLAGVYALADVAYSLTAMVTMHLIGMFGIVLLIVPTLIYTGLLSKIMEIEFQDAIIVAVITTIAKIVAVATLIGWLQSLL